MRRIADQVLSKLDRGVRVKVAKEWADAQVEALPNDAD